MTEQQITEMDYIIGQFNGSQTDSIWNEKLKKFIAEVEEEAEKRTTKAFGGCTLCYGKGYSTQRETISGGHGRSKVYEVLDPINPCTCDRGVQIENIMRDKSLAGSDFDSLLSPSNN